MAPSRRSDPGRLSPAQHERKEKQLKRTCLFSPITHRGRGARTCKRKRETICQLFCRKCLDVKITDCPIISKVKSELGRAGGSVSKGLVLHENVRPIPRTHIKRPGMGLSGREHLLCKP